ncbi:hypothetical protein GGD83_004705 [Rhodoblastus sphagnicola]|nr:hypothetical protein [Rhodoblastus sphagnicola]
MRKEFRERRHGGLSVSFLACAAVKSRTRQPHIAKQRMKYNRVTALASPPAAANFTELPALGPSPGLCFDDPLLGGGEQSLAFGERQSEIFGASDAFAKSYDLLDAARRAVIISDLKQTLHAHCASPVGRNHAAEAVRARMMV